MRSGNYKLMHFFEKDVYELYNLQNDKGEKNNLIAKEANKAKEMKALMDQWRSTYLVDSKINRKASSDHSTDEEELSKEEKKEKKKRNE
jgi:arylsulfatase A-like enzyme